MPLIATVCNTDSYEPPSSLNKFTRLLDVVICCKHARDGPVDSEGKQF